MSAHRPLHSSLLPTVFAGLLGRGMWEGDHGVLLTVVTRHSAGAVASSSPAGRKPRAVPAAGARECVLSAAERHASRVHRDEDPARRARSRGRARPDGRTFRSEGVAQTRAPDRAHSDGGDAAAGMLPDGGRGRDPDENRPLSPARRRHGLCPTSDGGVLDGGAMDGPLDEPQRDTADRRDGESDDAP